MSTRIDITNKIFNDIWVLKFLGAENTHAKYKCLCMRCNELINVTYSNLENGNTKSCGSCCKNKTPYYIRVEILKRLTDGKRKIDIMKDLDVSRGTIRTTVESRHKYVL